MRYTYIIILIMFCACSLQAQNIIPNGNFEDTIPSFFGSKFAKHWTNPTKGSPDYLTPHHDGDFGAPQNFAGYQNAHSGTAYFGLVIHSLYNRGDQRREYVQVEFKETLITDSTYCLRLYISLADSMRFASRNQLGVYFSIGPINSNDNLILPFTPQIIVSPDVFIADKENWVQFDFEYTASGGEKYITIGNFNDTTAIDTFFVGGGRKEELAYIGTYYYIDDVYLGNCDSIIGLPEINLNQQITVYPNPAKEQLFISYEGNEKLQLKLYNLVGQTVEINQRKQADRNLQIPLNHLSKGVYFLEIIAGEQRISRKVIKR